MAIVRVGGALVEPETHRRVKGIGDALNGVY